MVFRVFTIFKVQRSRARTIKFNRIHGFRIPWFLNLRSRDSTILKSYGSDIQ